jgi:hypothetical protein
MSEKGMEEGKAVESIYMTYRIVWTFHDAISAIGYRRLVLFSTHILPMRYKASPVSSPSNYEIIKEMFMKASLYNIFNR